MSNFKCSKGVHVATRSNTYRHPVHKFLICRDCVNENRRQLTAQRGTQRPAPVLVRRPVDVAGLRAARQATSPPRVVRRRPPLPAGRVAEIAQSDRWREVGACGDEDPELFFPVGMSGPAKAQEAQAKAVCARCPVLARCFREAMETRDQFGIRGGTTESERRDLLRRQRGNHTPMPAQTHNSAGKQRQVVESRGATEADFESAMSGMTVLVPAEVKPDLARRMFQAGKSKSEIGRALRMSGRTVKRVVEQEEGKVAS